jgi:hypothetical protein
VVKLQLAFAVGFVYVVALWFYQSDLHSSVALVVLPLWFLIALRCASAYGLLVFLAYYLPQLRVWLLRQVRGIVEREDW